MRIGRAYASVGYGHRLGDMRSWAQTRIPIFACLDYNVPMSPPPVPEGRFYCFHCPALS